MSAIEIRRDWSRIDHAAIARFLARRFYGPVPRILVMVAGVAAFGAGLLLARALHPASFVHARWVAGLVPVSFMLASVHFLNGIWRRKLSRAVVGAPFRRENRKVILSARGICEFGPNDGSALNWRHVSDVVPYGKDTVLLLLSPLEYIPLQMDGLPPGVSRDALLERIAGWRSAARAGAGAGASAAQTPADQPQVG